MKILRDILYGVHLMEVIGDTSIKVKTPAFDSRKAGKDSLFVAVPGTKVDGHQFIDAVIKNGATAIIVEKLPENVQVGVTYLKVRNAAEALAIVCSNYFDVPSSKLKLIGVTGTNGKTTIATLLYTLFTKLGYKCGLLSTVNVRIANKELAATHTTPDPLQLNEMLALMVEQGCEYCFMEVSSHAVAQHRIAGLQFSGGVFSNLTRDHLDYHKTFKDYLEAKKAFFTQLPKSAFALTNIDDKNGKIMVQDSYAKVSTYSVQAVADYKAKVLESNFSGMLISLDNVQIWTSLIGQFNASNLAAVYGTAMLLEQNKQEVLTLMSTLQPVAGRFQYKMVGGISGIVDYAHTPDALKNVLQTIKEIRTGNEQLITIVGCGGNRDQGKRPIMAGVAAEMSDRVILTSDNPRDEEPNAIIEDMRKGIGPELSKKVLSITDRREAIKTATALAKEGDIILVAGKGHETYQEIKGERFPFNDLEELEGGLNQNHQQNS